MFITINDDSFNWWWEELFIKHQKVRKCNDQDCSFAWAISALATISWKLFVKSSNTLVNYAENVCAVFNVFSWNTLEKESWKNWFAFVV